MKLNRIFLLAALSASPAFATSFTIDFEKNWDYGTFVDGYYDGGSASDGTSGPNYGASFVNVLGLSNDASFTYYANAPSMTGIASPLEDPNDPNDKALMNLASGLENNILTFWYSSPQAVIGAVRAYSGLDGTGNLLGSLDLGANSSAAYDTWSCATLGFVGTARSFDFTAGAGIVGLDNISVPEPGSLALMLAGGPLLLRSFGANNRRRKA